MTTSVLLFIHIVGGSIGLLTGYVAAFARKGSRVHLKSGDGFFVSMLVMASTGAVLSTLDGVAWASFMAGSVTFYMVATSWRTAKNRTGENGLFEWAGLTYISIIAVVGCYSCWLRLMSGQAFAGGVESALDFFHFFYTAIAILGLLLDIRVLYKGGVQGAQRMARHLWRMTFALWVATGSFFLGQPQVFPEWLRSKPMILATPWILVTGMLFFWLIKVYVTKRYKVRRPVTTPPILG